MARYAPSKNRPKARSRRSRTPLFVALAGIVLIAAALWAVLDSPVDRKAEIEVTGSPRLKLETTKIDHGEIKLGQVVRDEVRVTNVGDQPLRFTQKPIVEAREGC